MRAGTTAAAATCSRIQPRLVCRRVRLPVCASPVISDITSFRLGACRHHRCVIILVLHRHVWSLLTATRTKKCRPGARLANSHREEKIHPVSVQRRHIQTESERCQIGLLESGSINIKWAGVGHCPSLKGEAFCINHKEILLPLDVIHNGKTPICPWRACLWVIQGVINLLGLVDCIIFVWYQYL